MPNYDPELDFHPNGFAVQPEPEFNAAAKNEEPSKADSAVATGIFESLMHSTALGPAIEVIGKGLHAMEAAEEGNSPKEGPTEPDAGFILSPADLINPASPRFQG
jgi:hypothetical protein